MTRPSLSDVRLHCAADVLLSRCERHLRAGRTDRTAGSTFEALRDLAATPAFDALLRRDLDFADRVDSVLLAWRDLAPEPLSPSLLCDRPCPHCRLTPSEARS